MFQRTFIRFPLVVFGNVLLTGMSGRSCGKSILVLECGGRRPFVIPFTRPYFILIFPSRKCDTAPLRSINTSRIALAKRFFFFWHSPLVFFIIIRPTVVEQFVFRNPTFVVPLRVVHMMTSHWAFCKIIMINERI